MAPLGVLWCLRNSLLKENRARNPMLHNFLQSEQRMMSQNHG